VGPGHHNTVAELSRRLGEAIEAVGLDPNKDEATLLKLILKVKPPPRGRYGPGSSINWIGMALRLLRTGGPRSRVTAKLAKGLKGAPTPQGIGVLAALDARRAQPLKEAHPKLADGSWLLPMVHSKQPDPPTLRAQLRRHKHWTVFQPTRGNYHVAPRSKLPALRRAIARHLGEPTPLKGKVDTAWIVDIYSKKNWKGFEQLPQAQLWVARDGSFGFSWQPEASWGRSPALARLLTAIAR
jgi:hypothetical protein